MCKMTHIRPFVSTFSKPKIRNKEKKGKGHIRKKKKNTQHKPISS